MRQKKYQQRYSESCLKTIGTGLALSLPKMIRLILAFILTFAFAAQSFAQRRPDRGEEKQWSQDPTHLSEGTVFRSRVEKLKPTQLEIGKLEVKYKAARYEKMTTKERFKDLKKDPIRVVIGPRGDIYVVDHHHHALAVHESGHSKLYCLIEKNWSHLSEAEFENKMIENNFVLLYDQNGNGPKRFSDLPKTLFDMADNAYRSLVSAAARKFGWPKDPRFYAEFIKGYFFKRHMKATPEQINAGGESLEAAIQEAYEIDQRPGAKEEQEKIRDRYFPGTNFSSGCFGFFAS